MDVNFRKIDIDQYDEDVLVESELYEPDPRDPGQVLNDTKQKAVAVRGSLSKCVDVAPYVDHVADAFPAGETSQEL